MKTPKTDKLGHCVECGRLIIPNDDDITKAQLVLQNAGYACINVDGHQTVYLSPCDDAIDSLQGALDTLKRAIEDFNQ